MYVRNSTEITARYVQSSGQFSLVDGEDCFCVIAHGYSGRGSAINSGAQEHVASFGPIPIGAWSMLRAVDHPRLGAVSIPLSPLGHRAYGRTGFYIHGDNSAGNGSASSGCIILGRAAREAIRALGLTRLDVVV